MHGHPPLTPVALLAQGTGDKLSSRYEDISLLNNAVCGAALRLRLHEKKKKKKSGVVVVAHGRKGGSHVMQTHTHAHARTRVQTHTHTHTHKHSRLDNYQARFSSMALRIPHNPTQANPS